MNIFYSVLTKVFLCLLLTTTFAWAQQAAEPTLAIEKIAFEGEPAPGTNTNFVRLVRVPFSVPIINALGTIVFNGDFLVPPDLLEPASGIWKSKGGITSALVLKGDEATGIALARPDRPDVKPTLRDFGAININNRNIDGGEVLFIAGIDFRFGGITAGGLWTATNRGNQFPSVTCTDLGISPGTIDIAFCFDAVVPESNPARPSPPMIDDGGTVVFRFAGISRVKRPEQPTTIATVGQQAPDITDGVTFASILDFVVTPGGDVAFAARLQGTGVTSGNDTAIFKETNKTLGLVVREGDQTPGGVAGGTFGELESPAINGSGVMAFRAFVPGSPDVSIWTGTGLHDLELVADTDATTALQPVVVTFSTFGPPVINDNGDVAFIAVDQIFTEGVWSSISLPVDGSLPTVVGILPIVQEGNDAPGTIGAVFAEFDSTVNVAINKAGRVAFVGLLDINSPGVTFENQRGIWAQDPNGALTLIAREGRFLEVSSQGETTILDRVDELSFAGGSGHADGRPSGFSDNGEVTFRATFNDGTSGIFRATFQGIPQPQPTGEEFIWSGACGNPDWHAQCSTNWNDKDGNPQPTPPGDKGDEILTINNANVFLTDRAATVGSVNSTGKLEVHQDLTLAEDSNIEAIQLLGGNLTSNGNLRITGTSLWQSGTISSGAEGIVTQSGTLDIVQAATGDPPKKLTGTNAFENQGTVTQQDDIDLSNAKIDNQSGATWSLEKGDLIVAQGEGTFINRGTFVKSKTENNTTPTLQTFFEAHQGSRLEVHEDKLTLNRGAEFTGDSTIVLSVGLADLNFGAVGGTGIYQLSPGTTVTVNSETGQFTLSRVFLLERAVLTVQNNAVFRIGPGMNFKLEGGTISGPGKVEIEGRMRWSDGMIGLPDRGADSGNVVITDSGLLAISPILDPSSGSRILAGTLRVGDLTGIGDGFTLPQVVQFADLTINGGLVRLNAGQWTINGSLASLDAGPISVPVTISASTGGQFLIFTGQRSDVDGRRARLVQGVLRVNLFRFEDVTFSAPLINEGRVEVNWGRLRLTGEIAQVSPLNRLTSGVWVVRTRTLFAGLAEPIAILEMPGKVIKIIGEGAEVVLDGGSFPQLRLGENFGTFTVARTTYETPEMPVIFPVPAALQNFGKLEVGDGGILKVKGGLVNGGSLVVFSNGKIEARALSTLPGSKTRIDGAVTGVGVVTNNEFPTQAKGGVFCGDGTISGERFNNRGDLLPGSSPGVLTINADYTQFPEGILEIEIGGTTPDTQHDQLVVNGNADIAGTLVLKFIDDFSPQAGQTFEFLSVSGTQTGQFDRVEIVNLAPGFEFEVTPTDAGMMMTATTDGVFTGIVGEINDVRLGFDTPPDESTALQGDTNVPMLQFEVVPETDGLTINRLTLKANGTGDDAADLTGVAVWLDDNENGRVDPELPTGVLAVDEDGNVLVDEPVNGQIEVQEGDRQIGSGTYDSDNGTLNLTIDPPYEVPPRETATLLVTYNIAGGEAEAGVNAQAQALNDTTASPESRLALGLGAITFPMFMALTLALGLALSLRLVATRRYRATALVFTCMLTAAWIVGCPGPGASSVTFRVTLTGIGAEEAGTNADASVDNLSLTGTTLTVRK